MGGSSAGSGKPDNIFLLSAGGIRILDFGIARLREIDAVAQRTRTGSMLGTPAFMLHMLTVSFVLRTQRRKGAAHTSVGVIEMVQQVIEAGVILAGKWRLDERLGEGAVGEVWSATHNNGHRVAIKLLKPTWAVDGEARERFLHEGYAANRVGHPGAVKILDDFELDDGTVFLVMELLEGESLKARWLRYGGRMAPAEVVAIARQVLEVLDAAHRAGVVHRDLKPDNIFLLRDGSVRLLDFGVARLERDRRMMTCVGTTLGTPIFMPPEQALGQREEVGPRSDLFALGATMASLISGAYVRPPMPLGELLLAACTEAPTPLAVLWPTVHPALAAVVDRALSFRAEERWASARDMAEALAALPLGALHGCAPGAGSVHVVTPTIPSAPALDELCITTPWPVRRRSKRPHWLFAAAVVLGLMLSGWLAISIA